MSNFKGFKSQFDDIRTSGKKFHDVDIQIRYNYINLDQLASEFLEQSKTIGSDEQLETWIYDLINKVYSIGFTDSRIQLMEQCGYSVNQQMLVEEIYEEQEHGEDCGCDDCNDDYDEYED
jgi:hypothetical protein